MNADLRIPVTVEQKRLIAEAVADAPNGLAAWARDILVQAAVDRIAERKDVRVDANSRLPKIQQLLQDVYRLSEIEMVHGAGDLIFDFVHDALRQGDFGAVDHLLESVEPSKLKSSLMITFLSTTLAAKHKLEVRDSYFQRVLHHLSRERGPEKASRLLEKYR
jgi:hypothetical protein